jgi:hypothetical protein
MMTWFEQLQLIEPDSLDLEYAIQTGKLEMCRYFHAKGCGQDDHTESSAVDSGSPEVCDWLLEVNFTMNMKLLAEQAALLGKLAVLQWALQHDAQLSSVLLGCAAESGCLEVFQYLVSQGCEWHVYNVCFYAALGGSVHVLTYVFDQLQHNEVITEPALLTDMLNAAGAKEQLEAAKWLRQRGAEWPAVLLVVLPCDAGEKQAHKWRNATLRWARAEGCTSPTA